MTVTMNDLVELLAVTEVSPSTFVGKPTDYPLPRVFGGQVVGQAMSAATRTVDSDVRAHSVQCQFLRPGRVDVPIRFEVDHVRDGRSFATRGVDAYQGDTRIFAARMSFHRPENGFEHQFSPPAARDPETLPEAATLTRTAPDDWPAFYLDWEGSLDIRIVPNRELTGPPTTTGEPARSQVWMRAKNHLRDANQSTHTAVLACISDLTFLSASLVPHGIPSSHPGVQMASLDHCVWFHRPFRVDEWLLYEQVAPSAHGGLGIARGEFWSPSGEHVASVVQEGLIRPVGPRSR